MGGYISDAIRAMEYVIDQNIRLSNNSWGGGGFSQSFYDVIEASQAIGHIFVAAAGNYGHDNDVAAYYPATYDLPNIITVAATDNDDNLADFSNYGATTVELGAPGVNVYSTVVGPDYGFKNGTSMATPHVSGVVALVMSRYPGFSWDQVRDRILQRVRPVGSLAGITMTGGVVSAAGAVSDCNDNGVPDEQDIAGDTSEDCTDNGIPDDCEWDCNGNDQADSCDILEDPGLDCDENGILDQCEPYRDCNGNEAHDPCDIRDGLSEDCNNNWLPDECEPDCNGNDVPDDCDIIGGTSPDCNENWTPDDCEPDCNGNGVADECDIDGTTSDDCNGNLIPDECDITDLRWPDDDGNDVPDVCQAAVLFVDAGAPGLRSGLGWTDAFTDLQDALGVARGGGTALEEVWVAAGTYKPDRGSGDRSVYFELVSGTAIYGGFAGGETSLGERDVAANPTILSGDLLGDDGPEWTNREDNSCTVVYGKGVDETAVLDGFTITAGNASGARGKWVERYGAGVFMEVISMPIIANCTFSEHSADYGGAVFAAMSFPTLTNCAFTDNVAVYQGGGMCNWFHGEPTLTDCSFTGNQAYEGGGMYNAGYVTATLVNCTFNDNWAEIRGAGLCSVSDCVATLVNCRFDGNVTPAHGGAVRNAGSTATLVNCAFSGNSGSYGGGMSNNNGDTYLTNCSFYGNIGTSYAGPGGVREYQSSLTVSNCIFWGNYNDSGMDEDAQIDLFGECTAAVDYSCIQGWTGGFGGLGNHGNDPAFMDPDGDDDIVGTRDDDLRLSSGSPCVDAGDNAAVPTDTLDLDDDDDIDEPIPFDLAGYPRFVDDLDTPDTGNGEPPIVDMGSYEFMVDCNGNRVPDHQDLLDGTSPDCNQNDIPDECDIASGTSEDCQSNDVPDECDVAGGTSEDCQPNDIPDECDIAGETSGDCNGNDLPDECEIDEDCNENGVQDICDIAGGTSGDCNTNDVPDECEPQEDCNGNEVQDICDIAGGTSADCQPNGVPDECDLSGGASQDLNGNGAPDECDAVVPLPEDSLGVTCMEDSDCREGDETETHCVLPPTGRSGSGTCYVPKTRYLSVVPNPVQPPHTARRITLQGEPGWTRWVGAPVWIQPSAQHSGLWFSLVSEVPTYDGIDFPGQWPSTLHVSGCEIAIGQTYLVWAIASGQDIGNENNYSEALELRTSSVWGDTVSTCTGDECRPANGIVGLDDIMAAISRFLGVDVAPITWLDIAPSNVAAVPDQIVGIDDILGCIAAFQGGEYPGSGPLGCP